MPLHLVSVGEFNGDPQYQVYAGTIRVGAIRRVTSPSQTYWSWTFSLSAYPPEFKTAGSTFELEHAMSAFKRAWIIWLRSLRQKRK